ncbi:type II toxin-antitoxin system HicB family antitoxin [Methyloceanibacter marginalis]|uniref:type II toxin-antitoxin system HicB family antitoxin n=1 Tax=Methyloceanibacter marginalis TaxID=1774971 RepID=UPI00084C9FAA|nr:type II toxin-antitoxin system HicB family antitoxin [Methyloceanibacter marginalis]
MSDQYAIVIVPLTEDEGGGYAAYVPDLHGCMSDGETEAEAAANVRDAIVEWCDEAKELGRDIPEPGSFSKRVQEEWDTLVELVNAQEELGALNEAREKKLVAINEAKQKKCEELEAQVAALRLRLRTLEPIAHRAFYQCFEDEDVVRPHVAVPVASSVPGHLAAAALTSRRH